MRHLGEIAIATLMLCVRDPLVPVTERVKEPVELVPEGSTVSVEVAVELEGGVIGLGRVTETPVGAVPIQEYVKSTDELNPFIEVTAMVEVPATPGLIESDEGVAATEKSGGAPVVVVVTVGAIVNVRGVE